MKKEIDLILRWDSFGLSSFRRRTPAQVTHQEVSRARRQLGPHPPVAVPAGAARRAAVEWLGHPLAGSLPGHLQDRGLGASGQTLGQTQEPSRHELRQTVPLHSAVLSQGHHAQNRAIAASGLSVLRPLPPPGPWQESFSSQISIVQKHRDGAGHRKGY